MVTHRKPMQTWQLVRDMKENCNAKFPPKNTLYISRGIEGFKHRMVKMAVMSLLKDAGIDSFSEVAMEGGVVDIFDATRRIIIECETELDEAKKQKKIDQYDNVMVREFIFIDLRKVPENLNEMKTYLEDKVIQVNSD